MGTSPPQVPTSAHVRAHIFGPIPRLRRLSGRRFTRERSLVRNQPRPSTKHLLTGPVSDLAALVTGRERHLAELDGAEATEAPQSRPLVLIEARKCPRGATIATTDACAASTTDQGST
jgi:hypothetical protein